MIPLLATRSIMNTKESNTTTQANSLTALAEKVEREFTARYQRAPEWIVAAPGRVNLIGEHIDYNDGFVLPMAIERYVVIGAAPGKDGDNPGPAACIYSMDLDQDARIGLAEPSEPGTPAWSSYVEGVLAGFLERGSSIPSFDAVISSNVPLGGGLSSSAALEVATATLVEAMLEQPLEPEDKALLCQRAEHRFAGVPCGIMDQFSSVFGENNALILLDCRSQQLESVPFLASDVTVLITNSNVKHELTGGEYAQRRAQCDSAIKKLGLSSWRDATMQHLEENRDRLEEVEYRRARHVISEIERTTKAAEAFRAGQWDTAGELMYQSHESLRADYEVSCEELDLLVDLAREIGSDGGVIGSRMTGGGFGGCTVTLVKSADAQAVAAALESRYREKTGIEPHVFASRPARGAHVIRG
jgi:galactokinase